MTMYKKIKELPENQKTTTVVLLALIEEKETRAGKPYCELTLSDGETQIQAKLWNNAKADVKVEEKSLITAELYPKEYQGALSYELFRYGPAPEDCQITDYVIKAPYKPEDMYQEILNLLRKEISVSDPEKLDLIDLVKNIYEENKENLLYWSAAKSVHHNCYSGLLYHTFRMVRSAVMLSRVYPVDRELLLAGTALHDIGKLSELETDNLGVADYSVDGNLFGHSLIGCEMVTKAASKNIYDEEKVRLLKHMIASHHGTLEFGAITKPSIPEAMLLHEIDMIDAQMYQYEQTLEKLEPGEMSDRIFGLGGFVYKKLDR